MPNAVVTEFGNVVVKAKVGSRSTKSTHIVEDSANATKQTMTRAEYERIAADMGNRMLELLDSHEMKVFVLNTGRVGGGDGHEGSKKMTIPYSSATVQAIVEHTISWTTDPDFGYEIAESVPGIDDIEILQPRRLYEGQGRLAEYEAMVARMKRERREYLASFAGLDEAIVKSIG